MHNEAVTIATVTYAGSFVDIADFLNQIQPAIEQYAGECELLIVNNSGVDAADKTEQQVVQSGIRNTCAVRVVASPENNISTARNMAFEKASNDLLIFLDDDEFPVPKWITYQVEALNRFSAQMVSGPTYPLYLFDAPQWVKSVDLHNTTGRTTGQVLDKSGAGNFLIRRSAAVGDLFSETYGRTGAEDTEFVLRQVQSGLKLVWCLEAAAYEYMPQHKSTSTYHIKRFIVQGQLHRKVMTETGAIGSQFVFVIKSIIMIFASAIIAPVLVLLSSRFAGRWMKRGFSNIGHLSRFSGEIYPSAKQNTDLGGDTK